MKEEAFYYEFNKFYQENMLNEVIKLDYRRQETIINLIYISILSILVFYFLNLFYKGKNFFYMPPHISSYRRLALLPLSRIFILPTSIINDNIIIDDYKNEINKIILPKLISFISKGKKKSEKFLICNELKKLVKHTELFNQHNNFSCEYSFCGRYKDIKLNISKLNFKNVKQTQKYLKRISIFNGFLFQFNLNKKFNGITIIKRKQRKSQNEESNINIENSQFQKLYTVKTTDENEARNLLTEAFIDKMIELSQKDIGKKGIMISFKRNKINIAVDKAENHLKIPIIKSLQKISNYKAIVLKLMSILSIIDTLKLDENTKM